MLIKFIVSNIRNLKYQLLNFFLMLPVINNSMSSETKDKSELLPNESLSLRCMLDKKNQTNSDAVDRRLQDFTTVFKENLSFYCIRTLSELKNEIFQMHSIDNFLLKAKTRYFQFSQQNLTNEELNSIVNSNNRHMTICLNWKASISDNGKFLRNAFGQHFVQIDHLFES